MEGGCRASGLLAHCIPEYPGFLFSSTKEGQRELSTHKLVPGVVFNSRGSRGFEAPLQCHLETRSSPGDEDGRGALQRSFRRAACVYRGLRVTPDLRRLLRGRKAPVVDTEEALETWAETHRLQSACPPPPLRSCYLSNDESLRSLESRTTRGTAVHSSREPVSFSDGTSFCTVNAVVYETVNTSI